MQFLARRPQFQHFSRDHNPPLRVHRGQGIDHRVQRLRIGIVAIVNDRDVTQLDNLSALVRRSRVASAATASETSCRAPPHGNRRQRVQNVVLAHQRQTRVLARATDHDVKLPNPRRPAIATFSARTSAVAPVP